MSKDTSPLVTIMIPVYNRENLIEDTLLSALNQDFDDFEVVVVDNQSTDNTYNILKEYSKKYDKLQIYQNDRNLGPVLNWKAGIDNSRGKYLKILWSDDLIESSFLKNTVPILEQNDDIGFVYTSTILRSESTDRIDYVFGESGKYLSKDFIKAQYMGGKSVPLSPGNALFRVKDIKQSLVINIENSKGLDFTRYGAGNDLLVYLITANMYKYFYFINENFSIFKAHDESFSIKNDLQEYYLISKVFFISNNPDAMSKQDINKFYTKLYCDEKYRYIINGIKFNVDILQFIKEILIKIKLKIRHLI